MRPAWRSCIRSIGKRGEVRVSDVFAMREDFPPPSTALLYSNVGPIATSTACGSAHSAIGPQEGGCNLFSRPEERSDNRRRQRPGSELAGNEVLAARAGTPESV